MTMRRLDPASATGFSSHKERDWNETEEIARAVAARKRYNNSQDPADLEALEAVEALRNVNIWRKQWADYCNRALEEAGSEARIDHRTLEKQGIFRVPEIVLGVARHIEKAYDFLKERVTQWVGIKKRASIYREVEAIRGRDPAELVNFLNQLSDMTESFAAQFRKPPPGRSHEPPEVPRDR